MSNLPKRYQTVYECKIGQGQQGNCFKWALERVLSKIVFTIIYSVNVIPVTLKYTNREQISEPIPKELFGQVSKETIEQLVTRIGLAQFFGEWIALYCGNEGDIKDAYVDVDANTRMTDADAYSDNSMCGLVRPQHFANTPEVLMYNFSRIVNFILDDFQNLEFHIHRLLAMKYPICLGIVDPTFSDITQKANYFLGRPSGVEDKTYAIIVKEAFTKFFTELRKSNAYLDLKTVTLHRKPYVIYKDGGNTQVLVPQIDINVGNVALKETDLTNVPERLKNNYFEEIAAQIEVGLYAEISVYMPKLDSPEAKGYFEKLGQLTEGFQRQKIIRDTMTTRRGNIGEKNVVKSMASQLPEGPGMSGHSMALRNIRVDKQTKQIYITFINSWDDQEYVEYPVNIFFRVELHALLIIDQNPGHIRTLDAVSISTKYMEISTYVPSCIPEYMLQMVASDDNRFYCNENAEVYRVKLTNHQSGWVNPPISPIKKVRSIDSDSESENELDETIVDSPDLFSQEDSWRDRSPEESQKKRLKTCELKPNNLSFEEPMEVCTQEKCRNLPVLETVSKKRKLTNNYINESDTEVDDFDENDFEGGKKNKPKTNKRRAKHRKRVTRKLKKKRVTCRVKPRRILKRRTYKKQNKRK